MSDDFFSKDWKEMTSESDYYIQVGFKTGHAQGLAEGLLSGEWTPNIEAFYHNAVYSAMVKLVIYELHYGPLARWFRAMSWEES